MLSPPSAGRTGGARRLRSGRCRFAFGGVVFELLMNDVGPDVQLDEPMGRFCADATAAPTVAHVSCTLQHDASLPPQVGGDALWMARDGDTLRVGSRQIQVELQALGAGRYRGRARLASSNQALEAVLRGVAAALVEAEGGLVLHACGLELDGRAVLFVGPSGVGKSTATCLAEAGHCFAYDHVAVFEHGSGPVAWGLPGGSAAAAPRSSHAHLPLSRILRIRRGQDQPRLQRCDGAAALFVIRESVESAEPSQRGEQARLSAAMRLATRVEVGELWTVLGHSLTGLLREAGAQR